MIPTVHVLTPRAHRPFLAHGSYNTLPQGKEDGREGETEAAIHTHAHTHCISTNTHTIIMTVQYSLQKSEFLYVILNLP